MRRPCGLFLKHVQPTPDNWLVRLLKRGKWEFAVQVDADASLVTVDRVVRGVQRRSGDTEDPERLSGDEFRALLPPREPAQGQSI